MYCDRRVILAAILCLSINVFAFLLTSYINFLKEDYYV